MDANVDVHMNVIADVTQEAGGVSSIYLLFQGVSQSIDCNSDPTNSIPFHVRVHIHLFHVDYAIHCFAATIRY